MSGMMMDESWELFSRNAFGEKEPPEHLIQPLKKFLHLCKGFPLAIVVVARFLQSKNEDEWKNILATLEKNVGDDIHSLLKIVLKQSYNHFPSPLKACFAYLSLFPRDFEFSTLDVVSLWQAQGFLDTAAPEMSGEDQQLEDLGEKYYSFLAQRAFLTPLVSDEDTKLATFKIHDLLHDFASKAAEGWEKTHVSLIHGNDPTLVQDNLMDNHKLKTFLCFVALEEADTMTEIRLVMKLSKFKSLRVLDLHGFGIQILPDSNGNLIHLRYLDLSHNQPLVKLPNSITNLYNLQTLKLNCCYDLKKLPINTRKLACLRRLEIDGCEKLTHMPPGFENLTSLRILSRYVVGRPRFQSTSGFHSLGSLNRLQGRLMIELSENWTADVNEVTKSNLSSKTRLTELAIKWGPARHTSETDSFKHQTTLDGLQPPPNLKMLHIEGYRGPDFPRWAKANTFTTALPELVTVSIDGSGQCKTLPPFSRLPHLRRLTLRFMDNVQFFENSYNQSSTSESQFFPTLEELTLHGFYCLERWCEDETLVSSLSFDYLEKLKLWSCPKLEFMPLFPDVEVLDLQNINKKLFDVCNATSLPSSSSSQAMNSVPRGHPQNLPRLKTLHVKGCPNLKTLALEKNSGKLKKLVVERLDMVSSLTEVLKQLTSLEELEISSCKDLDLSGGCQRSCGECEECSMPWKSLSTLRRLTLRELTKLHTLPVSLGFIGTLKFICISACNNLSVLPEWIRKFSSLQHLRLEGCLALSELPEKLKDIRSLVKVDIIECPKLMERCRKGGEDWHKIKHARVLCHKSWRYALMTEAELPQKPKNQGENIAVHSEDPTIHVDVTVRRQPKRNM
uniref:NB-ARC domain-containing protein n=1 Tax=Chenopodium quinoa TaxID=63459 RepID=A0A803LC17_CHEQI